MPCTSTVPDVLERIIADPKLATPTFVLLEDRLLDNCRSIRRIADALQARALYSLKALCLPAVVPSMARLLHGFSVSSLFEARLARDFGGQNVTVHLTTPALRPQEATSLSELCDLVSLNSLSQLERYGEALSRCVELGLRVNPGLSFVGDPRYDPCAPESRLGVALDRIQALIEKDRDALSGIRGLHLHTNCESENFSQLRDTVLLIVPVLRRLGSGITWINLGGGYYFPESGVPEDLSAAIELLRAVNPDLDVYLEPGTAVTQDAGALVTTVLDIIEQSPVPIAILDTTINHLPEVFEYQYVPDVHGASSGGRYAYKLTGCSCLSGDVFGDCRFDHPLKVGSRLCFLDVGSYSYAKANMFNGIPMPLACIARADGSCEIYRAPTYESWVGSQRGFDQIGGIGGL
jgi:carboxynorspermidine decarboxylase